MIHNKMMGVVFGNTNDALLGEMTELRAISSLPFGGRYRLIDFALSNLIHADVSRVAVLTRANYRSLMDHLESGKSWDLARQNGGLTIVPPNSYADSGLNDSKIRSLASLLEYIKRSAADYIVLYNGDVVCNIDLKDMLRRHIEAEADISIAYTHGKAPNGDHNILRLEVEPEGGIRSISLAEKHAVCDYSLGILILSSSLLRTLILEAMSKNYVNLEADVILRKVQELKMIGYRVDTFAEVIDSIRHYIDANMALLTPSVHKELFRKDRTVYTKVRNEMPAKYGLESRVSNSLISDGCIIEGQVENSILFRGVKVGKGSVVRNCILMQSTEVGSGVSLDYVCADKNVVIGDSRTLSGSDSYTVYIRKGSEV